MPLRRYGKCGPHCAAYIAKQHGRGAGRCIEYDAGIAVFRQFESLRIRHRKLDQRIRIREKIIDDQANCLLANLPNLDLGPGSDRDRR